LRWLNAGDVERQSAFANQVQIVSSDTMAYHAIDCKRDLFARWHVRSLYAGYSHGSRDGWFLTVARSNWCARGQLDLACGASQTRMMAHIYIRLDFGTDEEKAQQARHKLDGWKQAFRLDKRVQYKLDRPESAAAEAVAKPEAAEKPAAAAKSKDRAGAKSAGKTAGKAEEPAGKAGKKAAAASDGKVGLLVRLYFSSHEKLSEQRWVERIPSEEPFKSAAPKIIHQSDPEFEEADKKFEALG
jgi:hypothetical protein